ncbi:MAG: outer membrane protein transport protein [Treponema sp.]|nr:outer membrane protein transport protein [Treponema sp.]
MKRFIIFALLVSIVVFSAFAQEVVRPFTMPSARNSGMGGLHITNTDGAGALMNNPAGLVGKREFGLLEISPSLTLPLEKVLDNQDAIMGLVEDLSDMNAILDVVDLLVDDKGRVDLGLNMGAPVAFTIVGGGFGLGLYSGAGVDLAVNNLKVSIAAHATAQANIAFGFRVIDTDRHSLDFGFGANAFYRVGGERRGIGIDDLSGIMDTVSEDPFSVVPLKSTFGLGLNLGVQYGFNDRFHVALAGTNLLSFARIMDARGNIGELIGEDLLMGATPAEDVNGTVAGGLTFGMSLDVLKNGFLDLTLMADYKDILNLFAEMPRNPILNVGVGAEVGLLNDFITARVGIADALPSLGAGINLGLFKLNAALYGKELGLDPGVHPVMGADISILFRW